MSQQSNYEILHDAWSQAEEVPYSKDVAKTEKSLLLLSNIPQDCEISWISYSRSAGEGYCRPSPAKDGKFVEEEKDCNVFLPCSSIRLPGCP